MADINKIFLKEQRDTNVSDYVGTLGEIFYDKTQRVLKISDGVIKGGQHLSQIGNLYAVNNRIGIGDDSPTVAVSIKDTTPKIKFIDSDATGTPETLLDGSGGDLILDVDKDNEKGSTLFAVKIDGDEKLRITPSGVIGAGGVPIAAAASNGVGNAGTFQFYHVNTSGNNAAAGKIQSIATGAFNGSTATWDADLVFSSVLNSTEGEGLRIKSGGRVGINTENPQAQLEVSGQSILNDVSVGVITASKFIGDGSGITGVTASGSGVNIRDNSAVVGVAGTINFGSNLDVSPASAGFVTVTLAPDGIYQTGIVTASKVHLGNLSGISTWTEDLVVVGDGRVTGILTIGEGSITIDPTAEEIKLGQTRLTRDSSGDIQIRDLAGNYKRLRGRRFRVETPNRASEGVEVGTGSTLTSPSDNVLVVRTNDEERIRVGAGGSVGIGTDNPDTLLHLYGESSTQKLITLGSGPSKRNNYIGIKDADNLEIGADADQQGGNSSIRFRVDDEEKVRILSDGRVGIGEDDPDAMLHLKRNATSAPYPGIKIENTANNVGLLDFIGSRTGSNNTIGVIRAYWENGSGSTTNVAGITFKSGSDTTNKDDGAIQFLTASSGSSTQRMIIQPNGEIAMKSNGTPTDALAGLHVQNGSFRVSQSTETGSIFKIQCHTDSQDGNRHKLAIWKNSGIPTLVSDCTGSLFSYASMYAGRTRSDANGPNNTYRHGSHGFYGYSSRTDSDANYRAGAFIRCWDAGDDADRNVIYITNSGDDTTTVDYDVHQKYGVKSSGMVHQTSHLWLGRVESDEGSPNSVYNGGNSQVLTIYSTSSSNYSQIRSRNTDNSDTCIDINTGGTGTVFKVTSNGQVKSDHGSAMGTPADYAEYFEWVDGNSSNVDRRGVTVVLDGKKVRPATGSDDTSKIIGVVSALPAVVGDSCWNAWQEKWLRDAYGSFITEEQEFLVWNKFGFTTNKEGVKTANPQPDITLAENLFKSEEQILVSDIAAENAAGRCPQAAIDQNLRIKRQARKLNPSWDSTKSYEPREDRPEWDAIGLLGKLSVRRGQPIGSNWVKMEDNVGTDPNDSNIIIDKYLVR